MASEAHDHDDHQRGHDRAHDDGHPYGHSHAPADFGRAFAIGTALNLGFVVAEVIYGLSANSLALLSDAGHNLSDVLGLVLAWGATALARRKPSKRFTYGLGGSSILAALVNAVLLLLVTGGIAWEALLRLHHPTSVVGTTVIGVAAVGIVINAVTAAMFMSGRKGDLNVRAAYLHMAADAAVAAGVVVAGIIILQTGWQWLDPLVSLIVGIVIVIGTWTLLHDSVKLALDAVPENVDRDAVYAYFSSIPGVTQVHDLHIWGMSTTETALTAHLVMPAGHPGDAFMANQAKELERRFKIRHPTLQVELGDSAVPCELTPDHVV